MSVSCSKMGSYFTGYIIGLHSLQSRTIVETGAFWRVTEQPNVRDRMEDFSIGHSKLPFASISKRVQVRSLGYYNSYVNETNFALE